MLKRKRRLTKEEIKQVQKWMNDSPQGRKPSVRQIAKALGATRPSVIKSLGGWKGIQRGRPQKVKRSLFGLPPLGETQKPDIIEPMTTKIPELNGR